MAIIKKVVTTTYMKVNNNELKKVSNQTPTMDQYFVDQIKAFNRLFTTTFGKHHSEFYKEILNMKRHGGKDSNFSNRRFLVIREKIVMMTNPSYIMTYFKPAYATKDKIDRFMTIVDVPEFGQAFVILRSLEDILMEAPFSPRDLPYDLVINYAGNKGFIVYESLFDFFDVVGSLTEWTGTFLRTR